MSCVIEDPEVIKIIHNLKRRALNPPPYVFDNVNFSLILMRLANERITLQTIADDMGIKLDRLRKWHEAASRPRHRYHADLIICMGDKYLTDAMMAECGVGK